MFLAGFPDGLRYKAAESIVVEYFAPAFLGRPLVLRGTVSECLGRGAKALTSMRLFDGDQALCSATITWKDSTSSAIIDSPQSRVVYRLRDLLRKSSNLQPVEIPDFEYARRLTEEERRAGNAHFDFHQCPRMVFDSFQRKDHLRTCYGILYISNRAASDTSGLPTVSEGALFTAVDEFVGGVVSCNFREPLATVVLSMKCNKLVSLVPGKDTALFATSTIFRAERSRKVVGSCRLYAVVNPAPSLEAFESLNPRVVESEASFVLNKATL